MSVTRRSVVPLALLGVLTFSGCAAPAANGTQALAPVPVAAPSTAPARSSGIVAAPNASGEVTPYAYVATTSAQAGVARSPAIAGTESATSLKSIATSLDPSKIVSSQVASAPAFANSSARRFYATVSAPSMSDGSAVYPLWLANVEQGVLAEKLASSGNLKDSIAGSSFSVQLPDGSIVKDVGGGAGDIASGQNFIAPGPDITIASNTKAVLAKFGLTPKTIRIFHPLQTVSSVTAVTNDAASVNDKLGEITDALLGHPFQFEALYVCLELPNGTRIAQSATDYRTGGGTVWTNPELSVGSGVAHG